MFSTAKAARGIGETARAQTTERRNERGTAKTKDEDQEVFADAGERHLKLQEKAISIKKLRKRKTGDKKSDW